MTREQREEAYLKARERIFGTAEKTGESTPGTCISRHCQSGITDNSQRMKMRMAHREPAPYRARRSRTSVKEARLGNSAGMTRRASTPAHNILLGTIRTIMSARNPPEPGSHSTLPLAMPKSRDRFNSLIPMPCSSHTLRPPRATRK